MVGPAGGVWLTTAFTTATAMMVVGAGMVLSGGWLYLFNPPVKSPDAGQAEHVPVRAWLRGRNLRLPNGALSDVPATGVLPDLVYRLEHGQAVVYLSDDGDPLEDERLRDDGWLVIRTGPPERWEQTVVRFPTVFGNLGGVG